MVTMMARGIYLRLAVIVKERQKETNMVKRKFFKVRIINVASLSLRSAFVLRWNWDAALVRNLKWKLMNVIWTVGLCIILLIKSKWLLNYLKYVEILIEHKQGCVKKHLCVHVFLFSFILKDLFHFFILLLFYETFPKAIGFP